MPTQTRSIARRSIVLPALLHEVAPFLPQHLTAEDMVHLSATSNSMSASLTPLVIQSGDLTVQQAIDGFDDRFVFALEESIFAEKFIDILVEDERNSLCVESLVDLID